MAWAEARWRKSSYSGEAQNACVELAHVPGAARILLRESDDPVVVVATAAGVLGAFVRAAKAGAFDAVAR
ncbi:DUF397 domain-containing protein [Streptomyces palmae]|uniref:DUF397 domain-containing protein n=1 Tax=Streptomyces palmae TaxID=1701085 RepID=UPI00315930CB